MSAMWHLCSCVSYREGDMDKERDMDKEVEKNRKGTSTVHSQIKVYRYSYFKNL